MATTWTRLTRFPTKYRLRSADMNRIIDNLNYLHDGPRCAVRRTSDLTVWPGEDTVVRFSDAAWDTHKMWDPGVPARVKLPLAGIYSISVRMLWDENGEGARHVRLRDQGGRTLAGDRRGAVSPTEVAFSVDSSFAAGNWVELDVRVGGVASPVVLRGLVPRSVVMIVRWVSSGPGLVG